jgi:hypothetical protein
MLPGSPSWDIGSGNYIAVYYNKIFLNLRLSHLAKILALSFLVDGGSFLKGRGAARAI